MTESWQANGEPLVLHVIPTPVARGGQREARALADELDAPGVRAHRVLNLFDGPREVAPDLDLGLPGGDRAAQGFDPRAARAVRRALARLDPAVVVAHGGDPLKYVAAATVGSRRPLVYYAIGTFAGARQRTLQVGLWRRLVRRADIVAAEGDEVAAECTTLLGLPPERVVMTPNGRDPALFHPGGDPGPGQPPLLTFVGALNDGKRPDLFIDIVAELRARGLPVRAQVAGGGPLHDVLAGPATAAGVDLLGPRSDIPELLRRSQLFVFPSRPVGEGMPGVLIEAGLSGLAVVATETPGVRTVIEDGVTGVVVPTDDRSALVDAVAGLVGDPARREAMGTAARVRCVERFSLEAVGRAWLGLIEPLLPHPG